MKLLLAIIAASLCSCADYTFHGDVITPYGNFGYTSPSVMEPIK